MLTATATVRVSIATDVENIAGLKELWSETLGDPRICVAILDGPVDHSHPSLANANLSHFETLVSQVSWQGPALQHGTHIASVIFGQHQGPIKGIAPDCHGLILPLFEDGVGGSLAPSSQLDLARAILQAIQYGAHIINISGGEFSPSGTAHPLLANAVGNAADAGILIVAAAGNDGCDCLHIPGALPSVLAVGAMDSKGLPLRFSNWGDRYKSQGVLAPGENILGAIPSGDTATNSGTSYATPLVSGIAALLLSLQLKRGLQPNVEVVRKAILNSASGCEDDPVSDCRRLLAGRLNIKGAIAEVLKGGQEIMSEIEERQDTTLSGLNESRPKTHVDEASTSAPTVDVSLSKDSAEEVQAELQVARPMKYQTTMNSVRSGVFPSRVHASTCNCLAGEPCTCGAASSVQLVFAIGALGYDFGTEGRRDSILQHMIPPANPYDPAQLLSYLKTNPWDAAAIFWTLNLDATPIYAIQAQGPFANDIYQRLSEFLGEQTRGEVERVSVPGYIGGTAKLFNGQVVPVIWPELRGMYSWNTGALVEAICGPPLSAKAPKQEKDEYAQKAQGVANFLIRVYDELRNLGVTPQDRAINYAATNGFQIGALFSNAMQEGMDLESTAVERSPICRTESDCWDVKLTFFNPRKVFEQARKVYRFTVDVSDVVPVMVGQLRSWFVR